MGSSEKFCLRWNDFQDNISVAFRELRDDSDFFDVTLACSASDTGAGSASGSSLADSGSKTHKTVRAHKVILSSCSIFFKDLLRAMNTSGSQVQPLIYLKGIKYEDLQSILDFMYFGEVNIAQEKLNSFLAVAEELRVKGLSPSETGQAGVSGGVTGENMSKRAFPPNRSSPSVSSAKKQRLVKRAKEEGRASPSISDIKKELRDTSPEPKEHFGGESSSSQGGGAGGQFHSSFAEAYSGGDRSMDEYSGAEDYMDQINDEGGSGEAGGADGNNKEYYRGHGGPGEEEGDYDYEAEAEVLIEEGEDDPARLVDGSDYRHKIRQLIKFDRITNQPYCAICNQSGSSYETLSNHVEARHIQRREYACQYCGKTFKTKNHKAVHIHRVHREEHKLAKVFGPTGVEMN